MHGVGPELVDAIEPALAIRRGLDLVTLFLQPRLVNVSHDRVIFNDEYLFHLDVRGYAAESSLG